MFLPHFDAVIFEDDKAASKGGRWVKNWVKKWFYNFWSLLLWGSGREQWAKNDGIWIYKYIGILNFRINLIYGTVCEQCTETSCPTMSGGPKFEYLWQDGAKYKKPTHLPAPQVCFF